MRPHIDAFIFLKNLSNNPSTMLRLNVCLRASEDGWMTGMRLPAYGLHGILTLNLPIQVVQYE